MKNKIRVKRIFALYAGRGNRFGRGAALYRRRLQLFRRLLGSTPTTDRAVFCDLIISLLCRLRTAK